MEQIHVLLLASIVVLAILFVIMNTTEGFEKLNSASPKVAKSAGSQVATIPATLVLPIMSAANAAPVVAEGPVDDAAPVDAPAPSVNTPSVLVAPKALIASGVPSPNKITGKPTNATSVKAVTSGISSGLKDVVAATTAGIPVQPAVGHVQQVMDPSGASAAMGIQNKPMSASSILSPSGMPSAMPKGMAFGASAGKRGSSCPSADTDDCDMDCGDDCNNEGFYNF